MLPRGSLSLARVRLRLQMMTDASPYRRAVAEQI